MREREEDGKKERGECEKLGMRDGVGEEVEKEEPGNREEDTKRANLKAVVK